MDCIRNASIVADEKTDLLVIERDLFNRSLKVAQEAELKHRIDFVNRCSLFENWPSKYKKQVSMSLRRETLPFDTPIVKQGAAVDGLCFIVKGQARVVVDPALHHFQYPAVLGETRKQFRYGLDESSDSLKVRFTQSAREVPSSPARDCRTVQSGRRPTGSAKHILEVSLIGANEIIGK